MNDHFPSNFIFKNQFLSWEISRGQAGLTRAGGNAPLLAGFAVGGELEARRGGYTTNSTLRAAASSQFHRTPCAETRSGLQSSPPSRRVRMDARGPVTDPARLLLPERLAR